MRHTPDPWYTNVKGEPRYQYEIASERTGKTIAVTYTSNPADAVLLASAPPLLSIAQDCLHQLSTDSDLDEILGAPKYRVLAAELRTVIAQATGEEA